MYRKNNIFHSRRFLLMDFHAYKTLMTMLLWNPSLINVIVVVFPSWSVKDNQFCVPHDKVIRKSHQKLKKVNKSLTYYTFLTTPLKSGKIERKNWYCKIWVKFHPMMDMKVYKLLKSDKKLSLALLGDA